MRRELEGAARRVLQERQRSLRQLASSMKDAAEHDTSKAPPAMKNEARKQAWEFSAIRREMAGEIRDLAAILNVGEPPADFALRIMRLSVASYLLDKLGEMAKATGESDGAVRVALFNSAAGAVKNILDDLFFFKGRDQIIRDYLDNEGDLMSCAAACSVQLCTLESAVATYKHKVAAEIDAINDAA